MTTKTMKTEELQNDSSLFLVLGIISILVLCLIMVSISGNLYEDSDMCNLVKEQKCIEQNMTYDSFQGCYDPLEYKRIYIDINCALVDLESKKMIERNNTNEN